MRLLLSLLAVGALLVAGLVAFVGTAPLRGQHAYNAAVGQVLPCPEKYQSPENGLSVCDAIEYVQRARGRSFRSIPEIKLLDEAEFEGSRLEDGFVDEESLDLEQDLYVALGLIDNDADLAAVERSYGVESLLGYYSFADGSVSLRGTQLNPFTAETLVHELSHAYDDQWLTSSSIPLAPPAWAFENDQQAFVRLVVEEGVAEQLAHQWLAEQSDQVRAEFNKIHDELLVGGSEPSDPELAFSLTGVSVWSDHQYFPYTDGPALVNAAAPTDSEIDDLVRDPPDTMERLIHPEVSDSDDPVVEVSKPNIDADAENSGVLGELQFSYVLGADAAAGWDGDRYVLWNRDGLACVDLVVAAESAAELKEMVSAADSWAGAGEGRSAGEVTQDDRKVLRMSNC